jgi:predicted RNase H-like nuclease (RuvC/YqgF family)
MSTQTITATRSASLNTNALDSSSNLAIQVLSQTEQMNNQVTREITTTLKSFEKMFADMQKTLNTTIQENQLLKKEIIQLNTKIKENEALHTTEMKKNTQTIATLSKSVESLGSDLRDERYERRALERHLEALVDNYNKHNHQCPIMMNPNLAAYYRGSLGTSHPYKK